MKLYGKRDLAYEPGARWDYSNYRFLLLGVIVERVTRQTYYDRVAATIFKPAGMTGTASPIEGTVTKGRVIAYTRGTPDAPWTTAADTLPIRATSGGGAGLAVGDRDRRTTLTEAEPATANRWHSRLVAKASDTLRRVRRGSGDPRRPPSTKNWGAFAGIAGSRSVTYSDQRKILRRAS
jgi:CubicO group peptidase (beta-lactamase class C family)